MTRFLLPVSLLAVTAMWPATRASAEELPSTMLNFAIGQEGSPIKFTVATSTHDWIYYEVRVRNVSDHVITSVTLGMTLSPISQSGHVDTEKGILIEGPLTSTGGLQPQDEVTLAVHLISGSDLRERRSRMGWVRSYAEIGVLKASYDGGEYVFDAMAHHGFDRAPIELGLRAGLMVPCKRPARDAYAREGGLFRTAAFAEPASDLPESSFYCADNPTACVFCTNNTSSCSVTFCTGGSCGTGTCSATCCAMQVCQWH